MTPGINAYERRVLAFKRDLLAEALAAHDGHRTRAAASLGMQRTYFVRLLRLYGVQDGRGRLGGDRRREVNNSPEGDANYA